MMTLRRLLPLLLLILLAAANLIWGSTALSAGEMLDVLTGDAPSDSTAAFILTEVRLPRLLTALLAGAALSAAGLVMQTVFANPLADPSILGVNSGAALGAALALLLLGGGITAGGIALSGFLLTVCAAFLGAAAVIGLLVLCSSLLRGSLPLLIAGIMISFAASAVISLLSFYATAQGVRSYVMWGMGDFSGVSSGRIPLFAGLVCAGLVLLCLMAKPLNALLLGNDYAANLGFRIRRVRTTLLMLTGLLTALVTALCGPIAFLGLAMPHVTRLLLGTADHRRLLPAAMLWGADAALLCNLISLLPGERGQLPVNALTSLLGIPFVFFILLRKRS